MAGALSHGYRVKPKPTYQFVKPKGGNLAVLYTGFFILMESWKKKIIDFLSSVHFSLSYGKLIKIVRECLEYVNERMEDFNRAVLPLNSHSNRWGCVSFDNYDVTTRSGSSHFVIVAVFQTLSQLEFNSSERIGDDFFDRIITSMTYFKSSTSSTPNLSAVICEDDMLVAHASTGEGDYAAAEDVVDDNLLSQEKHVTQTDVDADKKLHFDTSHAQVPSFEA